MATLPEFVQALGEGLYAIDTGFHRPRFDAAFLIVEQGRAAFVDTGTNAALPRHLATLEALGLAVDAVDYVIPTHVHLDHAGGAGALMQALPAARLVVHPRGARHMIDPRALYAGALAVYGQAEMDRSYGTLIPIAAERVDTTSDGSTLELAGRRLAFIDSPGHARHHHCIWDARTRGWFCGDTFGLSYREFDTTQGAFILPTSTPVQFDPQALAHTVARLLANEPQAMYLTHFGRVGDVARLGTSMLAIVDEMLAAGLPLQHAANRHAALKEAFCAVYLRHARAHGVTLAEPTIVELLSLDIELNAQGFAVWLDRRPR